MKTEREHKTPIDRTRLMAEGDVQKVIIKLAIPAIIGMAVIAIYNVVDTFFIGMLHDTAAVGAVSVVFPLAMVTGAVGLTFGIGGGSYVSRLLGAKDFDRTHRVASTAFFSSLGCGILVIILGNLFLDKILIALGASDTILPLAMDYARIIISGSVFQMINMTMNNLIRAEGNARYSGMALALGALLNIALDPLFIFGFGMGLKGAALATIIGQAIASLYLLSYYWRKKGHVHLSLKKYTPEAMMYAEIMKVGIPTLIQQVLTGVSISLINKAAMNYGDAAVAAIGINLRVISLGMMVIFGYCQGFQPVVGYNYGANRIDRVKDSIHGALKTALSISTLFAVLFYLLASPIVGMFSTDPEVLLIGVQYMRAYCLMFWTFGFQVVYITLFQALGLGKASTLMAMARQGLFLVPAILILPRIMGLNGIIWAQPSADFLTTVITIILAIYVHRLIDHRISQKAS